jgi:K+/H+ antiporter YhaU regulatory subunit KhtT
MLLLLLLLDLIRGQARDEPTGDETLNVFHHHQHRNRRNNDLVGPHKVVVTSDHEFVVIGVNVKDRPGLLLDISKGLSRLNLNLRHTEASVVGQRSISIWRCELMDSELADLEEIWSVLNALLESDGPGQVVKTRGLRVIRAVVTKQSNLIGKMAAEVDFRNTYKAAIVAVQKGGRNVALSGVVFGSGDVLVLQASEDSPLLKVTPQDFYKRLTTDTQKDAGTASRSNSVVSFVNMAMKKTKSLVSIENAIKNAFETKDEADQPDVEEGKANDEADIAKPRESDDGDFFIGDAGEDSDDDEIMKGEHEIVFTDMVRDRFVLLIYLSAISSLTLLLPNSKPPWMLLLPTKPLGETCRSSFTMTKRVAKTVGRPESFSRPWRLPPNPN